MFTNEEIEIIRSLAEPGEEIPEYAYLAATLGEVTEEDIKWAQSLNND